MMLLLFLLKEMIIEFTFYINDATKILNNFNLNEKNGSL